jgi:hypothetical protein
LYNSNAEVGDEIVSVNGQKLFGMSIDQALGMLGGCQGTTVMLVRKAQFISNHVIIRLQPASVSGMQVGLSPFFFLFSLCHSLLSFAINQPRL